MKSKLIPTICAAILAACSSDNSSSPTTNQSDPQAFSHSSSSITTYELDCNGEILTFTDVNAYSTARATCAQTAAINKSDTIIVTDSIQATVYAYTCSGYGFVVSKLPSRELCDSTHWAGHDCTVSTSTYTCHTNPGEKDQYKMYVDYIGSGYMKKKDTGCYIKVTPTDNYTNYDVGYYVGCETQFYQSLWTVTTHKEVKKRY